MTVTTTTLHLESALQTAARAVDNASRLLALVPSDSMPSPALFEAVYRITGTTEEDRLARMDFRPTPESEAAWCRSRLRRWAVKEASNRTIQESAGQQQASNSSGEQTKTETQTLNLTVYSEPGRVSLDTIRDAATESLEGKPGAYALASHPVDTEGLTDLYMAASRAAGGDSNDTEIDALWAFADAALDALGIDLSKDEDGLSTPTGHAQPTLTGHGYTLTIDPASTADDMDVPPAARIEHHRVQVMAGLSPVDNRMVVHIDGEPARIYFNDHLTHGQEQD